MPGHRLSPAFVLDYQVHPIIMETENQTEETQVGDSQLKSAAGDEAVSTPEVFTLEELNAITGKTFKSKESALKSIKDMNSMAGKAADLIGNDKKASETQAQYEARIAALEQEAFLARNPQHEANLELLQTLAKGAGVSLKEAAELPAYQKVIESAQQAAQSKRTIASPTNRVAPPAEPKVEEVFGDPLKSAEYVVNKFFK
jgi:hypothetical protein